MYRVTSKSGATLFNCPCLQNVSIDLYHFWHSVVPHTSVNRTFINHTKQSGATQRMKTKSVFLIISNEKCFYHYFLCTAEITCKPVTLTFDLQNEWKCRCCQALNICQVWLKQFQPFCLYSVNTETYILTDGTKHPTPHLTMAPSAA